MEREHANFRTALSWTIARGEGELAVGMATSPWRFWWLRAHWHEARSWFEQALAALYETDERAYRDGLNVDADEAVEWALRICKERAR